MTHEVVMPQLGLTMEEGAVVSWQKQLGDRVDKGEILFTVETDKAEMEVESTDSGYLNSMRVEIGKKVPVGTVIAILGDQPGEGALEHPATRGSAVVSIATPSIRAVEPKSTGEVISVGPVESASTSVARGLSSSSEFAASPRARQLAVDLGVDITAVKPSRGRRVVEEDVRRYSATKGAHGGVGQVSRPREIPGSASTFRKIVAQRMTESFQTAPHFYLVVEANATEILKLHDELRDASNEPAGFKVTYTDLFLRALTMCLNDHPDVNASWQNGEVQQRNSIDVGFAVQTTDGLIVPVIRKLNRIGLLDLAHERSVLTEKAKAGKLTLQELEGGSATLTNLGSFGVDWFQAILNPPQSVILATGRIAKRAMVSGDSVVPCPTILLSLSVDHRVLDEVAAAKFLGRIKGVIEEARVMLV